MSRSHARYLMTFSAFTMFGLGVMFTFAPGEIIHRMGGTQAPLLIVLGQACGAFSLGFAVLNWMAKDNLIGGIYSRPVAMGNFLHFLVLAMALLKSFSVLPRSAITVAFLIAYPAFAVAFGAVLFRHPRSE